MSLENNWQAPPEAEIREQVSAGASAMVRLMLSYNDQPEVSEETLLEFRQQFLDDYEAEICVSHYLRYITCDTANRSFLISGDVYTITTFTMLTYLSMRKHGQPSYYWLSLVKE